VTARLTLLVAAGVAVVALCTGCQGGSTAVPPPTNQTNSGDANGFDQQLDQVQSTLDSVQAQINADSTP
jgi:hypothetical protein